MKFQPLWDAYPIGTQEELFGELGGGWPALVGNPAFRNTCALRLSKAMLATGVAPPKSLASADGNLKDKEGHPLLIKVASVRAWTDRASMHQIMVLTRPDSSQKL